MEFDLFLDLLAADGRREIFGVACKEAREEVETNASPAEAYESNAATVGVMRIFIVLLGAEIQFSVRVGVLKCM
jgi:hypothetical protein